MRSRFQIVIFLFFMSLHAQGHAAFESSPKMQIIQSLETGLPVKIVCFGDSITGTYYHTGGRRAWTQALEQTLVELYPQAQFEMINAGIGGNTSANGLERMDTDVLAHQPNLIIAMFGMNDTARLTTEDLRSNLNQIVQKAQSIGSEIILMTPNAVAANDPIRPPDKLRDFANVVREVARENNLILVDTYQIYEDIRKNNPPEWIRLMSDPIHPNMRGHRLFASIIGEAISGQKIALPNLPDLRPGLPRLKALLEGKQPVRISAMKPGAALIEQAIHTLYPEAKLEITTWDPAGKSIKELEEEAKQNGWFHYNENPDLPKPDLTIVAVPSTAFEKLDRATYLSFGWVINWSQSFGNDPRTDCLTILPSVWEKSLSKDAQAAEQFALEGILDKDLPFIQRTADDQATASDVISRALTTLLGE